METSASKTFVPTITADLCCMQILRSSSRMHKGLREATLGHAMRLHDAMSSVHRHSNRMQKVLRPLDQSALYAIAGDEAPHSCTRPRPLFNACLTRPRRVLCFKTASRPATPYTSDFSPDFLALFLLKREWRVFHNRSGSTISQPIVIERSQYGGREGHPAHGGSSAAA